MIKLVCIDCNVEFDSPGYLNRSFCDECRPTAAPVKDTAPRGILTRASTGKAVRAPKLNYKPGEFVEHIATKQLYCIVFAFLIEGQFGQWFFDIEERKTLGDPSTIMSLMLEEAHPGSTTKLNPRICYVPFKNFYDAATYSGHNRYRYGDSQVASNQDLRNEYRIVSSGEVS